MSRYPRVYTNTVDFDVSGDLTVADDLTIGTTTVLDEASANVLRLATGDTLAITDADKLTVGGLIVPQHFELQFALWPHASITEYDLWVATKACQVTKISVVPSTLKGGALTATLVKAVSTDTPVKTTTPLHTADAIDLNANAYTVQQITLSSTTADLQFAVGDRLAIDFSAAYSAGRAAISVQFKRI